MIVCYCVTIFRNKEPWPWTSWNYFIIIWACFWFFLFGFFRKQSILCTTNNGLRFSLRNIYWLIYKIIFWKVKTVSLIKTFNFVRNNWSTYFKLLQSPIWGWNYVILSIVDVIYFKIFIFSINNIINLRVIWWTGIGTIEWTIIHKFLSISVPT